MEQRRAADRGQLSRQRGLPSAAGAVHRDQPRRPEPRRAPFHEGDEVVNAHLLTAGEVESRQLDWMRSVANWQLRFRIEAYPKSMPVAVQRAE
ncbi:hypothetical protein [Nocardia fluminea]|uniref:hypothetical protein n=1 Tax=Nocardia fluminea TaxID=134984 RepID=UPI0033FE22CD